MSHCRIPLLLSLLALSVQADTLFKCTDSEGHATYTNQKSSNKNCTILIQDKPVTTFSAPKTRASTPTPGDFPKVTAETQKSRDGDRRKIIEDELAAERTKLDGAKKDLAEQESQRAGGERNYQKYLDRVKPYQDDVQLHERNVESLEKELNSLR